MLEFTLLKRAIFAAIRPQFGDDLHSVAYGIRGMAEDIKTASLSAR